MPRFIDSDQERYPLEISEVRLLHDLLEHFLEQMEDMHECAVNDDIFIKNMEDLTKVTATLDEDAAASKYMMTIFAKDAKKDYDTKDKENDNSGS